MLQPCMLPCWYWFLAFEYIVYFTTESAICRAGLLCSHITILSLGLSMFGDRSV